MTFFGNAMWLMRYYDALKMFGQTPMNVVSGLNGWWNLSINGIYSYLHTPYLGTEDYLKTSIDFANFAIMILQISSNMNFQVACFWKINTYFSESHFP